MKYNIKYTIGGAIATTNTPVRGRKYLTFEEWSILNNEKVEKESASKLQEEEQSIREAKEAKEAEEEAEEAKKRNIDIATTPGFVRRVQLAKIVVIGASSYSTHDSDRWSEIDENYIGIGHDGGSTGGAGPIHLFGCWNNNNNYWNEVFNFLLTIRDNNMFTEIYIDRFTIHHIDHNMLSLLFRKIYSLKIKHMYIYHVEDHGSNQLLRLELVSSTLRKYFYYRGDPKNILKTGVSDIDEGGNAKRELFYSMIRREHPLEL